MQRCSPSAKSAAADHSRDHHAAGDAHRAFRGAGFLAVGATGSGPLELPVVEGRSGPAGGDTGRCWTSECERGG